MRLTPIKANMTELILSGPNAMTVLFSYKTPVAVVGFDLATKSYYEYKTKKRWSNTTTRHISWWFSDMGMAITSIELKPQEWFDSLVAGVK